MSFANLKQVATVVGQLSPGGTLVPVICWHDGVNPGETLYADRPTSPVAWRYKGVKRVGMGQAIDVDWELLPFDPRQSPVPLGLEQLVVEPLYPSAMSNRELTDEEIEKLADSSTIPSFSGYPSDLLAFARAVISAARMK